MRRAKPKTLILGLYIPLLLVGLMAPHNASTDSESMNFIKAILHDILFFSGPPEFILNFLLFIPFYFALLHLAPAVSPPWTALITCLTSATVELAQSQIPGRDSSLRDFSSNCLGVVAAFGLIKFLSKRTVE